MHDVEFRRSFVESGVFVGDSALVRIGFSRGLGGIHIYNESKQKKSLMIIAYLLNHSLQPKAMSYFYFFSFSAWVSDCV